ncbi:MAG TPA: membrane protein insertase YidC [Pyrinomonadaceae bacterium]|nr:membrane protein insertase YidC [Pyrinomonadaceae bacterium]
MQQKRLLLALVLSSAILFLWTYLYPAPPANQKPGATPSPTAAPTATQQTASSNSTPAPTTTLTPSVSGAPQRIITVRTPLYDAKFDTLGAEPISWIIKVNKNGQGQKDVYSVAGNKSDKKPLDLISPEGLKRQPRMVPFQLQTGDAAFDAALSSSTYKVEGVDQPNGDAEVNLSQGEKKEITFVLEDSNGIQVRKKIGFDGDRYATELAVSVKRGDQAVPQVKLAIGPSIGDQGVSHHTFYSVAPEAVAYVNNKLERHPPAGINGNKTNPDRLPLNGGVDWAGVGDTYFAMVAVPGTKEDGLEYRTAAYEYKPNGGNAEKRFLVTGYVPIPADGSRTVIYAGPKDHELLTRNSEDIGKIVNRPVDLDGLIDYGYLGWISRPIAIPILGAITYLSRHTGSYGIAIILFTIIIYSLFFPLKWRSSKAMKKAQKLAPQMKELQEKMKGMKQNDPRLKELQMDQLRLMKEGNPLGGCLPLLIQMPFLFALYRAITISLDFRQASFLWIPDLSAAEPYLIHILPILMTGTMIVLQLVTPAPSADPLQRKMMAIGMPVFMLYILWSAPSGLVLYWLVGNIVGFSQQFLINRWTKSDDQDVPAPPAKGTSGRKKKFDTPAEASEGS